MSDERTNSDDGFVGLYEGTARCDGVLKEHNALSFEGTSLNALMGTVVLPILTN